MRISLLLRREPFGEILGETLARHWSETNGETQRVEWGRKATGQRWWGNSFLNCFAAAGTPPEAFEVLRREYSHAPVWWKRAGQRVYVAAGTRFPTLRLLSNISFTVTPGLAEAGRMLVLGGNHRLRLLHPGEQSSTVILKARFDPRHLFNEIELRQALRPECAPTLLACDTRALWLKESYVVGTPINRLSGDNGDRWRDEAAHAIWQQVVRPSLGALSVDVWCDDMIGKFSRLVARTAHAAGSSLLALAQQLAEEVRAGGLRKLPVSWTHGDLQESNIIVAGDTFWVIDWESAARRFAAYDFFLLGSGGRRRGPGWPAKVAAAAGGATQLGAWLRAMPELGSEPSRLKTWARAFLLEELWYRAADAAEPVFFVPGGEWPEAICDVAAARQALQD
jgi:hypothetical protein